MTRCSSTPRNLKPGSKIAIISLGGAVSNPDFLSHTHKMIVDHGYEPVYGEHALSRYEHHYNYAGTPEQRLKDLQWALDDDSIDAIWATRGGYGCAQLLERIDLTRFARNPKWFIGYSDNTYLQSFLARSGFASIQGQNVIRTLNPSPESYINIFNIFRGEKPDYRIDHNEFNQSGKACGKLIGGNLTVVSALSGTTYNFDYENAILFIEEIGENAYYKIDRYMKGLEQTGAFEKLKGVIVGGMKNIANVQSDYNNIANSIIAERLEPYCFPKIFGFPNGHISDMRPIIIGSTVSMDVNARHATLSHI